MRDTKLTATLGETPRGTAAQTFHPWFGLASLFYMIGIILLSSVPRHPAPRNTLFEYGLNLIHIPMFAGLTFLLIRTFVPKGRGVASAPACLGVALLLVIFAVFDEWHQSFVPGRSASVVDVMLDMMGIGAVLIFYRLTALVTEEP